MALGGLEVETRNRKVWQEYRDYTPLYLHLGKMTVWLAALARGSGAP
ncbi:hypothetical protein [Streptomyces sp. NPDC046939]